MAILAHGSIRMGHFLVGSPQTCVEIVVNEIYLFGKGADGDCVLGFYMA